MVKIIQMIFTVGFLILSISIIGFTDDTLDNEEIYDAGEIEVLGVMGSVTTALSSQVVWEIGVNPNMISANLGNKSSTSLLEKSPSVSVKHYGGLGMPASVGLRGSAGNQTLVLSDGLPLNTPSGGSIDFSLFDTGNINRIEVVPGASGAFYGDSAIGGVINIIRTAPTVNKRTASLEIGSFGYQRVSANIQSSTASLPYSLAVSHQKWNGDFDYQTVNYTTRQRSNSKYSRTGLNFQIFDNKSINNQTKYNLVLIQGEGGSPGRAEFEDRTASKDEFHLLSSFNSERVLSSHSRLRYGGLLQVQSLNYLAPNPPIGLRVDTNQHDLGAALVVEYLSQTGWQGRTSIRYDTARSTDWNNPDRLNLNAGSSYTLNITERLKAIPAIGLSYVNDNRVLFSPSLGLQYNFNPNLTAKFNYAQATRFPSFPEMFTPDDGTLVGNPDLNPERITSLDGTLQFTSTNTDIYLSAFHSDLDDSIQFLPVSFFRVKAMNLPEAEIDGVEIGVQHKISESLNLSSAATWLTAQYSTGGWLPARPRFRLNSSISYDTQKFSGNFTLQNATAMPLDYSGNLKSPAYTNIDCELSYKLNRLFVITLSGTNLTDAIRRDAYDFPLPGRALKLGITFNF